MGQSGSIGIELDQAQVMPGFELSGFVFLDISTNVNLNEFTDSSLNLRIVGYEKSICATQASMIDADRHSSSTHVAFESKDFLVMSYPLFNSNVEEPPLSIGRNEFPFCIILPQLLPPTISASLGGSSGGECSISYYAETTLLLAGRKKQRTQRAEFIVKRNTTLGIGSSPAYVLPSPVKLKFCKLWKQGNIFLGLYSPVSLLKQNEPFEVTYILQNQSSVKIRAIEISLIEIVSWKAHNLQREESTILYSTRLEGNRIHSMREIPTCFKDCNNQNFLGQSNNSNIILNQWKSLTSSGHQTMTGLLLPEQPVRGDMKTDFIQVSHCIRMKVCTCIGVNNPEIILPITIYPESSILCDYHEKPLIGYTGISSFNGIHVAEFIGENERMNCILSHAELSNQTISHSPITTALPLHGISERSI